MRISWTWLASSVTLRRFFEILQFVALSGGFAFQHQRSLLSVNKLPLAIINLKGNEDQSSTLKNKKHTKEWNLYAEVSPVTKCLKAEVYLSGWLKTNLFEAIWKSDADVDPLSSRTVTLNCTHWILSALLKFIVNFLATAHIICEL